jgi:hypothetical protein
MLFSPPAFAFRWVRWPRSVTLNSSPVYRGIKLRRDTAHPMALVVAAEELALVLAFTHQEQQMAVGGLHVEDGDLGLGPPLADDLEELALAVGLHVQRNDARRAAATRRAVSDLQPCADPGKLDVEEVGVHERGDTTTMR